MPMPMGFPASASASVPMAVPMTLREREIRFPSTFSFDIHRNYYNMNIELC